MLEKVAYSNVTPEGTISDKKLPLPLPQINDKKIGYDGAKEIFYSLIDSVSKELEAENIIDNILDDIESKYYK